MKKISALLLAAIILTTFACSENKSSTESAAELPTQELQSGSDSSSVLAIPEQAGNAATQAIQQSDPVVPASTTVVEALNPAHGQPGHDCSIPVGAPLSSSKANAQQSIQMGTQNANPNQLQGSSTLKPAPTQAPVMAVPNQPGPGKTSAGLNPPHGEPGHDCGKPVGAPL